VKVRQVLRRLRDRVVPLRPVAGESPDVRILPGVKLYREVRIGQTRYRGSRDSLARPMDYVFEALPAAAYERASVLDVGTAGGAVCFGAVDRGASRAVGLELAIERIRGARALKRLAQADTVEFLAEDSFTYLTGCVAEFDVVFVLNVLHHVTNIYPLLHRVARASRRYVVIEGPERWAPGQYASYHHSLEMVDDAEPIRTLEGITKFMHAAGFEVMSSVSPPKQARFHHDEDSGRILTAFERSSVDRRRLSALQLYRGSQTRSFAAARADAANIDLRAGASLPDAFAALVKSHAASAGANVLLAGPRASGKSYFAQQFNRGRPHLYNSKVFKSPNADGRQGLARHLNPPTGAAPYAAEALLGPADDDGAHCRIEDLANVIKARPVVCLLLNVPFDEHIRRLAWREALGQPVDYDISLRFDCAAAARILKQAGAAYRVVSVHQTDATA
jgi:hypothetical protein